METRNVVKTVITISYKMIIFALVVILIYYARFHGGKEG